MPVYELAWTALQKSGDYPHMGKRDAEIWERFLDRFTEQFDLVAYDVALGGFALTEEQLTEDERLGWRYSTALKVDVVLARAGEVWVIEVRPHAGVSAIGGALCYATMAEQDGFTPEPIIPAVVTDRASPDIRFCAEQLGVTLIAVDDPA